MKTFRILHSALILFFVAAAAGCGTLGETRIADERITVDIGQAVMDRPEKAKFIREDKGVELLFEYLSEYLSDPRVRRSLKVHVTITEFRVGVGRDMMGIDVNVTEHDKELKRFHLVDTTSRGSQVKRLAKALAEQTYGQVRRL
jgi:hypothetical protein